LQKKTSSSLRGALRSKATWQSVWFDVLEDDCYFFWMKISQYGVIGSGNMGCGIAQVAAQVGYSTILFDISEAQLEKAKAVMEKSLAKLAEKGKLKDSPGDVMKRMKMVTRLEDLKNCDFVVEAATENREIKFKLFRDLDKLLPKKA